MKFTKHRNYVHLSVYFQAIFVPFTKRKQQLKYPPECTYSFTTYSSVIYLPHLDSTSGHFIHCLQFDSVRMPFIGSSEQGSAYVALWEIPKPNHL